MAWIRRIATGIVFLTFAPLPAMAAPTSPVGRWLTQGDQAIVAIAPCGQALCGTIHRILKVDPTASETDINNPDLRLRQRPTDRIRILTGFAPAGDRWGGQVYDPRSGRTYASFLEVRADGALALTGCVWKLCQTQTWRRIR